MRAGARRRLSWTGEAEQPELQLGGRCGAVPCNGNSGRLIVSPSFPFKPPPSARCQATDQGGGNGGNGDLLQVLVTAAFHSSGVTTVTRRYFGAVTLAWAANILFSLALYDRVTGVTGVSTADGCRGQVEPSNRLAEDNTHARFAGETPT
jgi:hypothetical protein